MIVLDTDDAHKVTDSLAEAAFVGEVEAGHPEAVLVVDGENFPPAALGSALAALADLAGGNVRAVVACARPTAAVGWRKAVPDISLVLHDCAYSGAGDMLVAMEAQRAASGAPGAVIAIASADRDFAPVLVALRAQGHLAVVVTANMTPPKRLKREADRWIRVDLPGSGPGAVQVLAAGERPLIEEAMTSAAGRAARADGWIELSEVGVELKRLGIRIKRLAKVAAQLDGMEMRRDGCVVQVRRVTDGPGSHVGVDRAAGPCLLPEATR